MHERNIKAIQQSLQASEALFALKALSVQNLMWASNPTFRWGAWPITKLLQSPITQTTIWASVLPWVQVASGEDPMTWSSMPPSLVPRIMRKKPFSPQYLGTQSSVQKKRCLWFIFVIEEKGIFCKLYLHIPHLRDFKQLTCSIQYLYVLGITASKNATNEDID